MKKYTDKDFYRELDEAIKSYEEGKPFHTVALDTIADKIDWCWKWRKITEAQMEDLANRVTDLYDGRYQTWE